MISCTPQVMDEHKVRIYLWVLVCVAQPMLSDGSGAWRLYEYYY